MNVKSLAVGVSLVVLAGCEKQVAPEPVDPVVKTVSQAQLQFDNQSRFDVSVSPWVGARVGGSNMFGKRESLQKGPVFTTASSTLTSLVNESAIRRKRGQNLDAFVIELERFTDRSKPIDAVLYFVMPRSWFEHVAPRNRITIWVTDKEAKLGYGHHRIVASWLPLDP